MTTDEGAASSPKRPRRGARPAADVEAAGGSAAGQAAAAESAAENAPEAAPAEDAVGEVAAAPPGHATFPQVVEDGAPIQAERVELHLAAVGRVDSSDVNVLQGAIGGARASDVSIRQGALGGALAGRVTIRQSVARSLLAREVVVEQSFVRTIVAAQVRVEKATGVGFLLARQVSGDVRVLVDWRAAAAFGAAFGFVAALVRLASGARSGRRRRG